MTGQEPSGRDLLARRIALVGDLSALTARTHKLIQELSAMEMEALRIELEIGRSPQNDELARELREVEDRAAVLRSSQADCLEETEAVEAKVEDIDRLIAAARGGNP